MAKKNALNITKMEFMHAIDQVLEVKLTFQTKYYKLKLAFHTTTNQPTIH